MADYQQWSVILEKSHQLLLKRPKPNGSFMRVSGNSEKKNWEKEAQKLSSPKHHSTTCMNFSEKVHYFSGQWWNKSEENICKTSSNSKLATYAHNFPEISEYSSSTKRRISALLLKILVVKHLSLCPICKSSIVTSDNIFSNWDIWSTNHTVTRIICTVSCGKWNYHWQKYLTKIDLMKFYK